MKVLYLLALTSCAQAQAGTPCAPDLISVLGDSISVLFSDDTQKALGQTYSANSLAVAGYTSAQVISTELPRMVGQPYHYATLMIGINDIATAVPEATTEANIDAILAYLVAFPVTRIIAMTIIPTRDGTYPWVTITPYNAHITAQATNIIRVIDTGTAFGGATPNTSLYQDGLHPNQAGQTLIAGMVASAMVAP